MKLSQARKMRDGLLKGDTVMAKAWKELISGEVAQEIPADDEMAGQRGEHTAASWKAKQEEGW